jgi:hypothetical protein
MSRWEISVIWKNFSSTISIIMKKQICKNMGFWSFIQNRKGPSFDRKDNRESEKTSQRWKNYGIYLSENSLTELSQSIIGPILPCAKGKSDLGHFLTGFLNGIVSIYKLFNFFVLLWHLYSITIFYSIILSFKKIYSIRKPCVSAFFRNKVKLRLHPGKNSLSECRAN